jgi:hypothetical protein
MRDCQACICLNCKHNIDLYYCEISHEYTCKGCEDYMGECADYNLFENSSYAVIDLNDNKKLGMK